MTITWHPFNSAHYDVTREFMRAGDGDAPLRITTTWSLLRHPRGVVALDTGAPPGDSAASMPAGADVVSRLRALGLTPADVTHVVSTHLHVDHVGGNRALRGARFLADAAELAYARSPENPVLAAEYPAEHVALDEVGYEPLGAGAVDLLGDGAVLLVPTPGHAAGHRSFLLRLPATGAVLVTGDAVWTRSNLDSSALPGLLWSAEAYRRSRDALIALAGSERAQWFFSHEPDTFTAEGWEEGGAYG